MSLVSLVGIPVTWSGFTHFSEHEECELDEQTVRAVFHRADVCLEKKKHHRNIRKNRKQTT